MDTVGLLSSFYGLSQPTLTGQQKAQGVTDPTADGTNSPVYSNNAFFNEVAQDNPDVAASLLSAQSTAALLGFGQSDGGDLFSAFYGSNGGAGTTESLLSAYYAFQIAPGAAANTFGSEPTTLALDGGITVEIASSAPLGNFILTYDAANASFTLTDGLGALVTGTDDGTGTVDFGNGLTLTLGPSFDPGTSLAPQGFQLFTGSEA